MSNSVVGKAIASVFAQGPGTIKAWNERVLPAVEKTPKIAGADGRDLVRFLSTADQFDIKDPAILSSAVTLAQSFGYEVTAPRAQSTDPELYIRRAIAGNVTEKDAAFLTLAGRAGRGNEHITQAVAVLDSGMNTDHVGLKNKLWRNPDELPGNGKDDDKDGAIDNVIGYDWVDRDPNPNASEAGYHGNHTSGSATAGTDAVKVMTMRAFSDSAFRPQDVADAIDNAAANGARIISMSFKVRDQPSVDAVKEAMARHPRILFVKSAGNDGRELESYPAQAYLPTNLIDNMAVIAAADADGTRAKYTNYSPVYATHALRGSKVHSFNGLDDAYGIKSGTSMSTPDGSNTFAKLLILDPGLDAVQLKQMATDATEVVPHWADGVASGGVVNKEIAYKLAALSGLVRRGECDFQGAADRLGLWGKNADVLIEWAKKYVA